MKKRVLTEEQLREIAEDLAASNGKRTEVVAEWRRVYSCSAQQVYAWAREGGWDCGRNNRSDAGSQKRAVSDSAIERAAFLKFLSTTAKYSSPMPADVAIDVLGAAPSGVRAHHINSALRSMQIDRAAAGRAVPRRRRRTERPNEEHQFDTSVCAIWYIDERKPESNIIRLNRQAGRDRNKPPKGKVVIRYVLADHMTHCIFVQYAASYESFLSSAAFFHMAWSRKPDPEMFPFCGVPRRLYIDQGATFKSGHIKQLCENLGIDLRGKQPTGVRSNSGKLGSPAAVGAVESAHWLIERQFESRMRLQKPQTLDELNGWAYRWCVWYNGTKIHSRYNMPRSALWSTIRSDELRIPPENLDVFMSLAERPAVCHIYGDLTIRFKGQVYEIEGIPVDLRETKAEVMYSPYTFPEVRVKGQDGNYYVARPLARMDDIDGGWYENAVLDGEFRSFRDTTTERSQKRAEEFDIGEVDPFPNFAERLKNLRFMTRAGEPIAAGSSSTQMPMLAALEAIRDALGRPITPEENEALRSKYGEWMTGDEIKEETEKLGKPRITRKDAEEA